MSCEAKGLFCSLLTTHDSSFNQAQDGRITLLNVIRIIVESRAVVNVAQGIKDIRIDSILDAMDRSVGKDRINPGRVGGAELIRGGPASATPAIDVDVLVWIGQRAVGSCLVIIARIKRSILITGRGTNDIRV